MVGGLVLLSCRVFISARWVRDAGRGGCMVGKDRRISSRGRRLFFPKTAAFGRWDFWIISKLSARWPGGGVRAGAPVCLWLLQVVVWNNLEVRCSGPGWCPGRLARWCVCIEAVVLSVTRRVCVSSPRPAALRGRSSSAACRTCARWSACRPCRSSPR